MSHNVSLDRAPAREPNGDAVGRSGRSDGSNTYFLGGPIRTQGPGSSNKRFRSWLASRSRS